MRQSGTTGTLALAGMLFAGTAAAHGGIFACLALASTVIFAWPVFLGALVMAAFVTFVSRLVLSRNAGRMASQ